MQKQYWSFIKKTIETASASSIPEECPEKYIGLLNDFVARTDVEKSLLFVYQDSNAQLLIENKLSMTPELPKNQ